MTDERWNHGMDGWRVRILSRDSVTDGREGQICGFDHPAHATDPTAYAKVWVLLDGYMKPLAFAWWEVRPA